MRCDLLPLAVEPGAALDQPLAAPVSRVGAFSTCPPVLETRRSITARRVGPPCCSARLILDVSAVRNEDLLATFNAMNPNFATGEGTVERVRSTEASIELDGPPTVRESARLRPGTDLKGSR
jgi:hypothetical protein